MNVAMVRRTAMAVGFQGLAHAMPSRVALEGKTLRRMPGSHSRRFARLTAVLLPLLLASGCAIKALPVEVRNLDQSASVKVVDSRPASETERTAFTYLITSSAYGIFRMGENQLTPIAPRILAHRLYEELGRTQDVQVVEVKHLVSYENVQSQLRGSAAIAGVGGLVGALIVGSVSDKPGEGQGEIVHRTIEQAAFDETAGDDEFKRGLYGENENPKRVASWSIYIQSQVGDRQVFTRSLVPVTSVSGKEDSSAPYPLAIQAAIDFHVSQY